jgi:hypothetical protein
VPDLWTALGYDRTSAKIAGALRESHDILVIEGPPGVGKSWLAQGIGVLWQEGGGSAILAQGDSLRSPYPLDPFDFAMKPLIGGWLSLGPAAANLTKTGERLLVGTGGIITSTPSTRLTRRATRSGISERWRSGRPSSACSPGSNASAASGRCC